MEPSPYPAVDASGHVLHACLDRPVVVNTASAAIQPYTSLTLPVSMLKRLFGNLKFTEYCRTVR